MSGTRTECVTLARVVDGKLVIRNRGHFRDGLCAMKDGPVVVTIAHQKATRSAQLNSLYWVGYVQPFAEHTGYTSLEMHECFKQRFLSSQAKRVLFADTDGQVKDLITIAPLTTRTLTEEEFAEYLRNIEALALELKITVGSNRLRDDA